MSRDPESHPHLYCTECGRFKGRNRRALCRACFLVSHPVKVPKPRRVKEARHVVYEAWLEGERIYVGYTSRFRERRDQHRYSSDWWTPEVEWRVTEHSDRLDALDAEAALIKQEGKTLWNVQGNPFSRTLG